MRFLVSDQSLVRKAGKEIAQIEKGRSELGSKGIWHAAVIRWDFQVRAAEKEKRLKNGNHETFVYPA